MPTHPPKPCARTTPREMHIYDEGPSPNKGFRRYKIEITEILLGHPHRLRTFMAHENQLERLKLRYGAQFKVSADNIVFHEQGNGAERNDAEEEKVEW